jgi:tetratricopeptide (TPR) repeat protein
MIHQIKSDQNQRQYSKIDESLSINIFNSNENGAGQSTSDLNGQFLHSQILIDCLIRIKSNSTDEKQLITLCKQQYQGNHSELKIVQEFEKDYSSERALWWYTRQSFLYRVTNKALRVQNIDLLYLLRFFIRDIEQQLEKHKCLTPIRVYRAQLMSNEEVETLRNSIGEIISMNSFLSTSLNSQRARSFFLMNDLSDDVKQVFFQIDADPRIENIKAFSNITSFSVFPDEEEILFMIGSIFRLNNVFQDNQGVWIVQMSLCSFNNHQLESLFQHMKNELGIGETNLLKFGEILKDMGKFEHAEKYILRLLNQLPHHHRDIGSCYFQLGSVAYNKDDYESSLEWYNKLLKIDLETLEEDHPNIASTHNNMAEVYRKKDENERALESYNKALIIYQRVYGVNHFNVATCLNNMGIVYKNEKKYNEALQCYEKSLEIREMCLPPNHPDLSSSHGNIGNLQHMLGNHNLALEHLHESLKIYSKSLPSQHPRIAMTLANIGLVYEEKNDFGDALSYYEKSARIYHYLFTSIHPDVVKIEENIRRVLSKLK